MTLPYTPALLVSDISFHVTFCKVCRDCRYCARYNTVTCPSTTTLLWTLKIFRILEARLDTTHCCCLCAAMQYAVDVRVVVGHLWADCGSLDALCILPWCCHLQWIRMWTLHIEHITSLEPPAQTSHVFTKAKSHPKSQHKYEKPTLKRREKIDQQTCKDGTHIRKELGRRSNQREKQRSSGNGIISEPLAPWPSDLGTPGSEPANNVNLWRIPLIFSTRIQRSFSWNECYRSSLLYHPIHTFLMHTFWNRWCSETDAL